MGNWSYNPTYRSYNPIYNWKGAHLVPGSNNDEYFGMQTRASLTD